MSRPVPPPGFEYEDAALPAGAPPPPAGFIPQNQVAEQLLRESVASAGPKDPGRQAEILRFSQRTGLPADVIDRHYEDIKTRAEIAETPYAQMLKETPKLSEFLTNPDNAAVSKDDHESLGTLEHVMNYAGNAVKALGASFPSTNAAIWGALQAPADLLSEYVFQPAGIYAPGQDPFAKLSKRFAGYRKEQEGAAAGIRPAAQGPTEQAVYQGLESMGQNLLLTVPAMFTGGAAEGIALGGMGTVAGGQSYGQAKDQGVGTGKAAMFALSQGLIEVATEKIPVQTLFKGLKDGTGFVKLITKELASEIPGEEVATVLQDLNEWAVLPENNTKTFGDYLRERPSAAAATAISTIVGTLGQVGVARVVDRAFLKSAGEAAKNSKTGQRMPEKLREFIDHAAHEGIANVYVGAEDIKAYAQGAKLDPSDFIENVMPGGRERYQEALATGQDVEIPIAYYVTNVQNSDAGAFFESLARLGSPERMNSKEADELAGQVTDEAAAAGSVEGSASRVREDIIGQMQGLGFKSETVDAYARLYEQAFRTMGERAGVDPFELYAPYRLKISRPLPEVLTQKGGIDAQLDTLIDKLRAGQLPSQGEMFGKSLLEFVREKGGLRDENGELANMEPDAERRPFQKNLIQETGLPLDTAREAAAEQGYIGPQSSIADFLDLIDRELRGQPVYAQGQENQQAVEQNVVLGQLDAYLKSRDVDVKAASNDEIRKLLQNAVETPEIDGASGTVLHQGIFESPGQRAEIRFSKDRTFSIALLENADLSSFLHETGHFYLEVFGDLAASLRGQENLNETQQRLLKDYDSLLKTLGAEGRETLSTEQHEEFARTFEAYLREGKAPTPALRGVFARFRAWLVNIYRSLQQLNVNLRPEVTAILDRMIASDEEIEHARDEAGLAALFENEEQAQRLGLSGDRYRLYAERLQRAREQQKEKLFSEYLEEYNRASKDWFKARRKEVREEVALEVYGQREYMALSFLKDGILPDESPLPEGVEALKLDAGALEERYGKHKDSSIIKALRKLDVYRRDGGVSHEQVAQLFGYSSGDELVQALVNARPMNELIDAETDDRMKQTYGDILTDGTAPEKARDAVMTEGRAEVIEAEMNALAAGLRATGPAERVAVKEERAAQREKRTAGISEVKRFIPSVKLARSVAEARIGSMRVRDMRPGLYYTASRREGLKAIEAVNRGDFAAALTAKQRELINVEMYRAAKAAQEETEKIRQYMRSFDETKKRERIGKAGEDYLDQIDALRDRFDFGKITQKQIDRRHALIDWVNEQQAKGLPVSIPAELLNEAKHQNYLEMTVEELRGLNEGVETIEHFARLKNRLLKSQAKKELDAAVEDIRSSIDGNSKGPRPKQFEVRLPQNRLARTVSQWFAAHRKLSSFLREMDGFKDGGTMWEYILRPINDAANAEALANEKATRELAGIFDEAFAGQESALYHKTFIPAINGSLSKMGRLMTALNWGNEGNRQRIRDGFRWNDSQVGAILDTLDEKDWKFVQDTWKFINSYWGQISDKEQRVTGVRPEKVEASPFLTRFGEVSGGYFPIKYEGQLSARAASNLEGDFAESIKKASYARATTQRGHTEARLEKVSEPVRLDFGVITEHAQQVIHDLTHHEMLIDVGRLLSQRQVQDSIYNFYGNDVVYENIKGAVHDIAWGNTPAPAWFRPLNAMRQGVVTASLGWNLVTSALQPFQVSNAMVRVGPKWVLKGFTRWARNAASMESTTTWIQERSDFMKTRANTQFREINEIRNKVGLDRGRVSGWIHDALHKMGVDASHMPVLADSYFYLIQKAQQIADIPTWLGGYEKAMASGETEDRAVALADQAVIDSQASGHIKDLAAVERQPLLKILTTFYSYNNLLLNQAFEVTKKNTGVARKLVDASLLLFLPSAVAFFVHTLAGGLKDDKDLAEQLIMQELSDLFGMMIGLREFSGVIQGYDYEGPAGLRAVSTLGKAATQVGQGEVDPAMWRSLNQAGGALFHYPATQVQRTAEGIEALWSGKTQNPAVILFGPRKE